MSEIWTPTSADNTDFYLHNPYGEDTEYSSGSKTYGYTEKTGWFFGSGNPEFWKYHQMLLVPGGQLLDVGCANGRSSIYFGLNGMNVTGIDTNQTKTDEYKAVAAELELNLKIHNGLLQDAHFAEASFDTVLLDHTFAHSEDRQEVAEVLEKSWDLLKPGGFLWIRANGIEDSRYWEMVSEAKKGYRLMGHGAYPTEIEVIDDGLLEHPCNCSGELQRDRSIFLDQLGLQIELAGWGAEVAYLQCIPKEGGHNKMFGEDYNRELGGVWQSGTITIIAKKPSISES